MSDKKDNTLRRAISPEIRVVDAKKGIVEYVASDETCDWYNEVILANGWMFTHFQRNAPFVDSHNYWSVDYLLGKVISYEVKDSKLIERVQWAVDVKENALAQLGWRMTEGGYLKAVSVGFQAVESILRGGQGFEDLAGQVGCDPAKVRRIFTKQEQLELSACILGANPNALAKSWEDGVVSNDELRSLGFGSDESQEFLVNSSKAWESPECDQAFRSMISMNMQRCFAGRKDSPEGKAKGKGTTPTTRAAGEAAEQRAAKRAAFLKSLEAIVAKR